MSSVLPFTPVPSTIAAFDYDGTLTHRDTLLPFLARVSTTRFLLALFMTAPAIAAFLLHLRPREHAKQALCKAVLRGRPRSQLAALAAGWVPAIALRPGLVARLRWHQAQGHHCVLVSASPDVYLRSAADQLGFADLICTTLETDGLGRLTGGFVGANCWGPEKLRRLQERYGPADSYVLHAYGDSKGDKWLIDAARHAWFKGKEIKP